MRLLPRRSSATFAALLFAVTAVSGRAHAQPAAPDSAAILVRAALNAEQQGSAASREESIRLYQRALPFVRAAGDRVSEGGILSNIAGVHHALGRPDSALASYARAVRILREAGDGRGEGAALAAMGGVHLDRGRADSARIYLARALAVQQRTGDRRGQAATLNQIGTAYRALGRADSARAYFGRALAAWRELGNTRGEAVTLTNLGMAFQDAARADSAQAYFAQALQVMRDNGDRGGEGATLEYLAALWARRGDEEGLRRAAYYWRQAGDAYLVGGLEPLAAAAWDSVSRAYDRVGARDSALAWLGQALTLRDTSEINSIDALLRSSPVLRSGRSIRDEERFVTGVRQLLARIRGRPTPPDEVPTAEAALIVLEELNGHRETLIVVQSPVADLEFSYRRWIYREQDTPERWTTRTATTRFSAARQTYDFRYIHPDTGDVDEFPVHCADSPCVVRIPRRQPTATP